MSASPEFVGWRALARPTRWEELRGLPVREPHLVALHPSGTALLRGLGDRERITLGRSRSCSVAIDWDPAISRTHAVVERLGLLLSIEPAGDVTNPVQVDGAAVVTRTFVSDGQRIRLGGTDLLVRMPVDVAAGATLQVDPPQPEPAALTPAERRVAGSLAADPDRTNRALAAELELSVDTVKTHLRAITRKVAADGDAPADRYALAQRLADDGWLEAPAPGSD